MRLRNYRSPGTIFTSAMLLIPLGAVILKYGDISPEIPFKRNDPFPDNRYWKRYFRLEFKVDGVHNLCSQRYVGCPRNTRF